MLGYYFAEIFHLPPPRPLSCRTLAQIQPRTDNLTTKPAFASQQRHIPTRQSAAAGVCPLHWAAPTWGENVGWIIFDTRATQGPHNQQARFDICENRFRGYVWGENIGWLTLDDATHHVALGPDCPAGDMACDGVIGLPDYAKFHESLTGPGVPTDCLLFDFDGDFDVDLIDLGAFQAVFTGQ